MITLRVHDTTPPVEFYNFKTMPNNSVGIIREHTYPSYVGWVVQKIHDVVSRVGSPGECWANPIESPAVKIELLTDFDVDITIRRDLSSYETANYA